MFLSFNKPSQARIDGREFSRSIKSKGIIISETTPWGWHGIKQPSGTHNTKKSLLTRGVRVLGEYSVGVAGQTVNLLPLWFRWFDSIFSHYFVKQTKYEDAVQDVRNSRLVGCRYKYAESSRISQDRETESHKTHILENGGSNPPPAINPSIVQRIKTNSQYTFFL